MESHCDGPPRTHHRARNDREAYPIDPKGKRVEVGAGFVGIASTFDAAGFRRVTITDGHSGHLPRLLVRLDLA